MVLLLETQHLATAIGADLLGGRGLGGEGGEGGENRRWRMILICIFSVFEPKSLKRAESGDTNMQFDM